MNKQRLFALLLAAVMSVSGSVTAFAEGEGTTPPADATVTAPDGTTGEDTDTTETDGNTTTEPGTGDTENEDETGTDDPSEEENADGNDEGDTPEADTPTTETPEASVSNELTQTMADTKELDIVDGVATVATPKDLEEALSNGEVSTIVLGANITASITIPKGRTVVLDLGEYTLTNEEGKHTITNNGTLTIQGNGTVDNVSHGKGALVNGGTVIMNGGTLTRSEEKGSSTAESGGNSWYVVDNNGGTMTVNGGLITNTSYYSSLIRNLNATFNMDGGELTNPFIALKNDDNGIVNITGGTISTTAAGGSALQNWGQATVTGGVLEAHEGAVAIYALEWSEEYNPSITTVLDGAVVNGNIMVCKDSNYPDYKEAPEVKIQGGEVNGNIIAKDYSDVTVSGGMVTGTVSASGDESKLKIEGGKFAQKPASEYVDADANIVSHIASNGEATYFYGDDAQQIDAEPGATVTVEKGDNITVTGTNVTVKNETGAPITINNSTVADGGNVVVNKTSSSSRDNDSDYYGNETWDDVKDQIADADEGDTIKISGSGLRSFPASVARELKGKGITLEIRKNGVTYKVNGLEIGAIDKIWYEFDELDQLLTADASDKQDEADKPQTDSTVKENPATGR